MENQVNQFDNDEVNFVVPILAESIAPRWGFVFHRFGSSTGNLLSFDVSGSLGSVMGRVKTLYQGFLPKSILGRFFSKVIVERGTINRSSRYDTENQVQVRVNIEDNQLTRAFRSPQEFHDVSVRDDEFIDLASPHPNLPLSQRVLSLRTVLNKKRLFWILVAAMLGALVVAGGVAALVSKNTQTVGIVIGIVMGLFCLFVAIAAWLWKLS